MDFEKICMVFAMQEPYYGIILSSMERVENKDIPTMGVGRYGNVFKLIYNPDFVAKLDLDETLQCLKHEVLHVAFDHFGMWEELDVDEEIKFMRNAAADMEINGYLDKNKFKNVKPVLAEKFGWDNFLGTKEYYSRIEQMNQPQQKQLAQQPSVPCNGGMGGQQGQQNQQQGQSQQDNQNSQNQQNQSGNDNSQSRNNGNNGNSMDPNGNSKNLNEGGGMSQEMKDKLKDFDDHSQWPVGETEAERQSITQAIEDMLVFAADEVEKSCGSIPGEIAGRIDKIRKRKPKPVADWRRFFRRYLGNEFTELIRKSKKRESKRFPEAAGNRHQRKSHILVGIDTSGSVSMPEYMEFFGQIKTLTASATFHVIECDAKIQHEYDFKGRPNEVLHGGGGTSFAPVIDAFLKDKKKYDALVYFTDGYAPIPHNTPQETLWIISSNGDHDRKKYRVNGAKAVFIPKKQENGN